MKIVSVDDSRINRIVLDRLNRKLGRFATDFEDCDPISSRPRIPKEQVGRAIGRKISRRDFGEVIPVDRRGSDNVRQHSECSVSDGNQAVLSRAGVPKEKVIGAETIEIADDDLRKFVAIDRRGRHKIRLERRSRLTIQDDAIHPRKRVAEEKIEFALPVEVTRKQRLVASIDCRRIDSVVINCCSQQNSRL